MGQGSPKNGGGPSDYEGFSELLTQLALSCGKDDIPVVAMDAL